MLKYKKCQRTQNTSVTALAPPLRVLFVTNFPEDLDIEKEQENFIHALGNLPSEGKVLIDFLEIGSLDEIENALSEGQHHIIHISGHGGHREGDSGILSLEDEYGNAVEVTGEELAKRLIKFSDLRLIFLSACETARAEEFGIAGALIKHGMPAVLGMRYSVTDPIAIIFTSNFYKYLCRGNSLSKAIFQARKAIWDYEKANRQSSDNDVFNMSEWYLPFLFLNQRIGALVDYSRQNTDTRYFFRKPKSILIGGKKIGQGFVGRRKQIIQLTHFAKEHRVVCIHGQGGIGKTTLAIRFAENFERGKRKIIQFWEPLSEEKILIKLANESKIEEIKASIQQDISSIDKLDILLENFLQENPRIVLFDNFEYNQAVVDSTESEYQTNISSESLTNFLTHFVQKLPTDSIILFTTRYKITNIPNLFHYDVSEMSFVDTYKLMNRFEKTLASLNLVERREVYKRLGGHPRALENLDGCLSAGLSWEYVVEKMGEVEDKLINHDLLLNMLWDKLNNIEQQVLQAAAIFRVPLHIQVLNYITNLSEESLRNCLTKINNLSLCYLEEDNFYVHRLTSTFALSNNRISSDEKERLHGLAAKSIEQYNQSTISITDILEIRWHLIQARDYDGCVGITFDIIRALKKSAFYSYILDLLKETQELPLTDEKRANVILEEGIALQHRGLYNDALQRYKVVERMYQKLNNYDKLSASYHQIGRIYEFNYELDKAFEFYVKSFKIDCKRNNKVGVASSYHQIGIIFQEKRNLKAARKYYNKALSIYKSLNNHENIVSSYAQLGRLNWLEEEYDLAIDWYRKVLVVGNPEEKAASYLNMSYIYMQKGELEKAEEYAEQSLNIYKDPKIDNRVGIVKYFILKADIELKRKNWNWENCLKYIKKTYELAANIKYEQGLADAHWKEGLFQRRQGNPILALKAFLQSYPFYANTHYKNQLQRYIKLIRENIPEREFKQVLNQMGFTLNALGLD